MTTVEVLRAARALIDTPEKWWGGGENSGMGICAMLAVRRVTDKSWNPASRALIRAIGGDAGHISLEPIFDFNDSHTHAEVMAAFDAAIANELAKQQEFTVEPSPVFA